MSAMSSSGFSIPRRPIGESTTTKKEEGDGIAPDDRLSATVSLVFFVVLVIIATIGTCIHYLIN